MNAATPPLKPGKIWYWIGALTILAGLTGAAVLGINSLRSLSKTVDSFGRIKVPGGEQCKLVFDKPGRYTIYYEYQTTMPVRNADCVDTGGNETVANTRQDPPFGLVVQLRSVSDPAAPLLQSVKSTSGDVSISLNGHVGKSAREVVVDKAGEYVVEVSGTAEDTQPYVLAVGRGAVSQVAGGILGALAVAGLAGLAGLLILILTGTKRRKHRKALMSQMISTPGYGPPGYPGAAPPPSFPAGQAPAPSPYQPPASGTFPWAGAPPPPSGTQDPPTTPLPPPPPQWGPPPA